MLSDYLTSLTGLVAGASTFLSAAVLGRAILGRSSSAVPSMEGLLGLVLGISIIGTVVSLISIAKLANPVFVSCLTFAPLVIWWRQALAILRRFADSLRQLPMAPGPIVFLRLIVALYIAYVAVHTLVTYLGVDLTVYHLVVMQDVTRNGGYVHNDFFFASGIPFGWHHFGLAAYMLAGPKGYLALAFCAFLAVLTLTHRGMVQFFPDARETGLADGAVVALCMVIAGMLQGSVSGTDIPALLFNATAIVCLLVHTGPIGAMRAFGLGAIGGFAVSIKLTTIPIVLITLGLLIWKSGGRRLPAIGAFGLGGLLSSITWPALKLWETGSPLPIFMNAFYLWGGPIEQLTRSLNTIWPLYGDWTGINFVRFFTNNMVAFSLLLACAVTGLTLRDMTSRKGVAVLLAFAAIGIIGLIVLSRRWDTVYHDRYHLLSYCFIAIAGVLALRRILPGEPAQTLAGKPSIRLFCFVLAALAATNLIGRNILRDRLPDGTVSETRVVPICWQILRGLQNIPKKPGDFRDPVTRFVAERTPQDSLVATTTIAPYLLDRPFLQLLPVAQNEIDLARSPGDLLADLRARGVTYLHIPAYTSFNPWADDAMQPYLANLRKIGKLPSVEVIFEIKRAPGRTDALYRI